MKKLTLLLVLFLLTTSFAWAYDKMMAESYAQYFKPFSEKATSKSLHMSKTVDFVKDVRAGKLFVIDIRTVIPHQYPYCERHDAYMSLILSLTIHSFSKLMCVWNITPV